MLKVPTLFGHEMAGEIAAIGEEVHDVAVGDRVVVANSAPCGECEYCLAGRENLCTDLHYLNGAFSEYLALRAVCPTIFVFPTRFPFVRTCCVNRTARVRAARCDACDVARYAGPCASYRAGWRSHWLLFVAVLARRGLMCCSPS